MAEASSQQGATPGEKESKKKRSRNTHDQSDSPGERKPAYLLQRQERDELAEEARALEELLEQLRIRAGLPTRDEKAALREVALQSVAVEEKIHVNDLYVRRLQSMVMNELLAPAVNPLATFIHLPRDMETRRAILHGMQSVKLRRGVETATQRFYHLDPLIPFSSEEKFMSASGEYHYTRLTINQFPNFQTARQLHEVFVEFLYNLEINVTEMLGQLTVREDTNAFHPTIWNNRFLTIADDVGVPEELNIVGFAQFQDYSSATNSPMGIIVYDTVNIDDLYPYIPEERTCKDVQTANMVCEVPKAPGSSETVVVLKQVSYVVQLVPQFDVAPAVLRQLQDNIPRWPNAMVKYLREYVVTADEQRAWGRSGGAAGTTAEADTHRTQ